jgi:hypothetical protein
MTVQDRDAVVARNRAKFGMLPFVPQRQFLELLPDPPHGLLHPAKYYSNIRCVDADHPEYGPLLQWFVRESEKQDLDEAGMLQLILDWSLRMPAQMREFERRQAPSTQRADNRPNVLIPFLQREVRCHQSRDLDNPWTADVQNHRWTLRLNDYPDDFLYTLIAEDEPIASFNDFPRNWKRSAAMTGASPLPAQQGEDPSSKPQRPTPGSTEPNTEQ